MEGITKAKNVPTGTEIKLTRDQLALRKIQDKKTLSSYEFQVDNLKLEIYKLEEILRLNLAEREIRENLITHRDNLKRFENLIGILKKRIKQK